MAKYDREFLVQYLQDIYALYLAENRIQRKQHQTEYKIERCQENQKKRPQKPQRRNAETPGCGTCYWTGSAVVSFLIYFIVSNSFAAVLMLFTAIVSTVFAVTGFHACRKQNEANEAAYQRDLYNYYHALADYSKIEEQNARNLPELSSTLTLCRQEREQITGLLEQIYNVNIIPGRYRDEYAIAYLYDYFSCSQETDLSMALNTYVLERIKDRLDNLIRNQEETILTLYGIMDNQAEMMRKMEKMHQDLSRRLRDIRATADEQNTYLSMIEANSAVASYFSAAQYFKNS